MYNRYIPQPDGSYRRNQVADGPPVHPEPCITEQKQEEPPCPPPPPCKPEPARQEQRCPPNTTAGDFLRRLLPQNLDTGDLIVILLLLLMAGDCPEDRNAALLTLAIYLFM